MERRNVGVCVMLTLCLYLMPEVSPAASWGFALQNGDVNGDMARDVSDGIYLLSHLFLGGPAPVELAYCGASTPAVRNGDSNGDGAIDVSDPIRLLTWLYAGGTAPADECGQAEGEGAGKANGVPRVSPPNSKAFGKSLAEWLTIYWRWAYGGGSPEVGPVELMPLPAGEVTYAGSEPYWKDPTVYTGEIEVEFAPGTPFVLPEYAWVLERYDGYPDIADDTCFPEDQIRGAVTQMSLTIDGVTVMSDANKDDFYVNCTPFDPIVPYAEPTSYGSVAAIAWQGVGLVSPPLPPGDHVIHLYERYAIEGWFGVVYDNTWHVHVK